MVARLTPAAATFGASICFISSTRVRTETSKGITDGMFAAAPSAPRFTWTRIWIGRGCFSIHLFSGSKLPSSSRGFLALGSSSSSSSSSRRTMPGGRMPEAALGDDIKGAFSEVPGNRALMVETPVMGPLACGSGRLPSAPGSAGVVLLLGAGSGGAELLLEPEVSEAVGGTMVCAGPASAPASRAAASAPASAASRICSSTEPNKSGLFATKLARLASTSSAKADSFRARSTNASFWCFHLGSSSSTFKWLDISSAGISCPVMGQRCMRRWVVAFLCRT
mmetsp:Transcript_103790/g.289056  ORF Transcript_103790/g.289056 Transcript_103790/m.289056 type:complete len:280 (+) Transcript_103790:247-1086(+)